MQRIFSIALMLQMCLAIQSQTINQKGVTYRYNGKNPRTPIGGVYIKAVTANNGEVSNEKTGAFELALNNLRMGSRIGNVRVTKQGMMVFNQQAVDEWSVRKDPLCLILCNADEFQKQKKNLIAIGESQAKKKYDKKLAELKKQNDAQQLKIDEYYNKLDSLENEYQNALKHMDEYADVFARIDESEVDTVTQRAIEMFNRGEIEESIHLLEQQNYMEKIKQANRTIEQADAMISTGEQAKSLAEQDKEKYIEGIKTQIAGYKLQNEWDKAKELLKGLADNLNTQEAIWDYAIFCHNRYDYIDAESYYLKYKDIITGMGKKLDKTDFARFALLLSNMAILYNDFHRYEESEHMFKLSIDAYLFLVKENPIYSTHIIRTLNNFAALYIETKNYSECEKLYKMALSCCEISAKYNLELGESQIASVKKGMALLNSMNNRFEESELLFMSVLQMYQSLAESSPLMYKSEIADVQNCMANLYCKLERYSEAEEMYKLSLDNYKYLAETDSTIYCKDLAMVQSNLANLFALTNRYSEANELYLSALEHYTILAQTFPSVYEPHLAQIQNNIANLYMAINLYEESEIMYKASIIIRNRFSKINLNAYGKELIDTKKNLAYLYYKAQRYNESENLYNNCIEAYDSLMQQTHQQYCSELFYCNYWLGRTMQQSNKFQESVVAFRASLDLYEEIPDQEKPTEIYWQCLYYLMSSYAQVKNYAEAYSCGEVLLPILKAYYESDKQKWMKDYVNQMISQIFKAILLGKYQQCEKYAIEALQIDSSQYYLIYPDYAMSLLMQGKVSEAEKIYSFYKEDLKEIFLDSIIEYEELKIIPEERKKDVERIKAMLKEEK